MQIVIDIPDEVYQDIQARDWKNTIWARDSLMRYIHEGVVLPEHHGRLIDADELYGDFIDGTEGYDCQTWNRIEIGDIIEDAHTVIEADKE